MQLVQVLPSGPAARDVDGDDAHEGDLLGAAGQIRGLQSRLHGSDQGLAVGGQGEAFHATIRGAEGQLAREGAVEGFETGDLASLGIEMNDIGAVLVGDPEAAVWGDDETFGVDAGLRRGDRPAVDVDDRLPGGGLRIDGTVHRCAVLGHQTNPLDEVHVAVDQTELGDRGLELDRLDLLVVGIGVSVRAAVGQAVVDVVRIAVAMGKG